MTGSEASSSTGGPTTALIGAFAALMAVLFSTLLVVAYKRWKRRSRDGSWLYTHSMTASRRSSLTLSPGPFPGREHAPHLTLSEANDRILSEKLQRQLNRRRPSVDRPPPPTTSSSTRYSYQPPTTIHSFQESATEALRNVVVALSSYIRTLPMAAGISASDRNAGELQPHPLLSCDFV